MKKSAKKKPRKRKKPLSPEKKAKSKRVESELKRVLSAFNLGAKESGLAPLEIMTFINGDGSVDAQIEIMNLPRPFNRQKEAIIDLFANVSGYSKKIKYKGVRVKTQLIVEYETDEQAEDNYLDLDKYGVPRITTHYRIPNDGTVVDATLGMVYAAHDNYWAPRGLTIDLSWREKWQGGDPIKSRPSRPVLTRKYPKKRTIQMMKKPNRRDW